MNYRARVSQWLDKYSMKDLVSNSSSCESGIHQWIFYTRATNRYIFYQRRCDQCGVEQLQRNGLLGDGSWRDVREPFRWEWEKEEFDKAEIIKDEL